MSEEKSKVYKKFKNTGSDDLTEFEQQSGKRPILYVSDLSFSPPTDVWETEKQICVMMEIADLSQDGFFINYKDGYLVIEGDRHEPTVLKDSRITKYHKKELDFGSFKVKIKMNTRILKEKITANYRNGMLFISLPKNISKFVEKKHQVRIKRS
jgi:HSP20 family molecular chaperone IbpA